MLTLLEIATNACATMALDDMETLAQAKAFARKRWQLLWSAELWPQSRTLAGVTLAAASDIVALPDTMEMPTLVRRADSGEVVPVEHELAAMLCDPGAFRTRAGTPFYWTLIEPAGGLARIRFSSAPEADQPFTVMGKAPCPPLLDDAAKPVIPGADLALVAHVEADLYEWQRQVGKAQVKRQEAMGIQGLMLAQAVQQTGQVHRIVPWDGNASEDYPFGK